MEECKGITFTGIAERNRIDWNGIIGWLELYEWDGMGLNRRLKENDNIMQWNNKMGWNEKEWK